MAWQNYIVSINAIEMQLASPIGTGDTSVTVQSGQGARLPAISGGRKIKAEMHDNATTPTKRELIHITAEASDVLTIERNVEPMSSEFTVPAAFSAGDKIIVPATAGLLELFHQFDLTTGNARGDGAIDLQTSRAVDNQVAAGVRAIAIGSENDVAIQEAIALGHNLFVASPGQFVAGRDVTNMVSVPDISHIPPLVWQPEWDVAAADVFRRQWAPEIVIASKIYDAKSVGNVADLSLPSSLYFYPEEVGATVYDASGVTVQPTIYFGTGSGDKSILGDTQTTNLTALGKRWRTSTLVSGADLDGVTSLGAGVAAGATATTLQIQFYWRGLVARQIGNT